MKLFDACVKVILRNEGGFQKDPDDPGNWVGGYKTGRLVGTKYGIAAKFFPYVDIENLTEDQAAAIYREYYWAPMHLEGINNPEIILQLFDMGVNAGKTTAIRRAQYLCGAVPDGVMGSETKGKINNFCGDFLAAYKHDRKVYYEWLSERHSYKRKYLPGWLRRIEITHLFG